MTYLILIASVMAGAMIQAVIGFGLSAVIMAFLPLVLPYGTCIGVNMGVCVAATAVLSIRYYKSVRWKVLLTLLGPSVLLSVVISLLSGNVSNDILYLLLGLLFIVMALWFFFLAGRVSIRPTTFNGLAMGTLCGIFNGLFAMCGPPLALYLIAALKDKKEYLATIQTFFFISNMVVLITRIAMGNVGLGDLPYIGIGWVALIIGTVVGTLIFKRIDKAIFNKIVYIFIAINGLWIIISRLISMLGQ